MSFSTLHESDFIGRAEDLSNLLHHVNRAVRGQAESVVLSAAPGMGKTELLRQLFGHLFWRQDQVIPFFYTVNSALLSAAAFSKDFLARFICQHLAFEKREQALLSLDGLSLEALSSLVEEQEASWAREVLDRYIRNSSDPIDALRIALNAPRHCSLATAMPVAVLIDEFHRIKGLHVNGAPDRLDALFEAPLSFGKTPYIVTGNAVEIHEMAVAGGLERIPLAPLGLDDATTRALSLLRACQTEGEPPPPELLRHLGGNPFYLSCLLKKACAKKNPSSDEYWKAYADAVTDGSLCLRWTTLLKKCFPGLAERGMALGVAHKISHAREPLSCRRIAKAFAITEDRADAIIHGLYRAGFIQAEFGRFKVVEDNVVQDVVDYLYLRNIQGRPAHEFEQTIRERSSLRNNTVRFEMTLPMTKEAELVAAQCLEQIGKNLQVNRDAVGQMQIAVIEACINAMEHTKGNDRNIYVTFAFEGNRMEVWIESSGQEFIVQETGEPFEDKKITKAPGRGWGIKLMKRFVDEVKFEKTARGTKTVLIKHFAKTADVQKEKSADRE